MPNAIKYKAGNLTGSLQKGNVALAVNDIAGPTSTTGWYNGPNFTQGTYQIIETAATGDPDVFCPQNDAELIKFVKWKGATGSNTGSVGAALAWIATQNNLLATNEVYPNIVTSGLAMILDAGFVGSYPTTASTWYDISGNNISGSLTNGPTFNTNGAIVFDGVDDRVILNLSVTLTGPFTWTVLCESNVMTGELNRQVYLGTGATWFEQADNDTLFIFNTNEANVNLELPTSLIPQNKFYTATVIRKQDNTFSFYYNGIQQTLRDGGTTPVSGSYTINTVGSGGGGRYWNGSIANALVYNRLLSDTEILQNYYQAPIVTNGLVFAVDASNLVSYESGSTTAYSLSLSGSRTTPVSCSLTNGLAFNNNNGGYFDFDGTDDQLLIENVSTQPTGIRLGSGTTPWMVNAWVKTVTGGSNDISSAPILTNRSGGPVYCNMGIGAGGVMKYNRYNLGWLTETGSIAVNNNQWHMLSWVNLNNNTLNMYVDGIFDKNVPSTIQNTFNPVDIIGASWAGYLNGDIAFLSISISSSLYTTQDIQQNFNAQKARFGL